MEKMKKLSRLMYMSWEIQRRKKLSRAKALAAAWTILNNEDITVFYLVKRYNIHNKPVSWQQLNQMALFPRN